jgi:hypothetical protein
LGERTYQGKRGYPMTTDTSVAEITAASFDGLVIPGGYAPDMLRRSRKVLDLTRDIYQAGKPVAFICHAMGPDLGRDRPGQARHQCRRDQGRSGQCRASLGGQRRRGGREPDLVPDASGSGERFVERSSTPFGRVNSKQ